MYHLIKSALISVFCMGLSQIASERLAGGMRINQDLIMSIGWLLLSFMWIVITFKEVLALIKEEL